MDWRRLGVLVGRYAEAFDLIQLVQNLKYDPVIFIPACGGEDLETLCRQQENDDEPPPEFDRETGLPDPKHIDMVEAAPPESFGLEPLQ